MASVPINLALEVFFSLLRFSEHEFSCASLWPPTDFSLSYVVNIYSSSISYYSYASRHHFCDEEIRTGILELRCRSGPPATYFLRSKIHSVLWVVNKSIYVHWHLLTLFLVRVIMESPTSSYQGRRLGTRHNSWIYWLHTMTATNFTITHNDTDTEQIGLTVTLQVCIREVLCSNLGLLQIILRFYMSFLRLSK